MEHYGTLLHAVCAYINGWEDAAARFIPESGDGGLPGDPVVGKRLPYGTVAALKEKAVRHMYVDGTCRLELPFAVILRVDGNAPDKCMAALDWFGQLTRHLEAFMPEGASRYSRCRLTDIPARERITADGTAVYRAAYVIEMRTSGT